MNINYFSRHQQWYFNNQSSRPSYLSNQVVSSTTLHTQGRSVASNQHQLKDTTLAPMRPSQFLEQKRWPPLEVMNNHQWKKNMFSNTEAQSVVHDRFGSTLTSSLRPAEVSFGNNTRTREHLSNTNEHPNYFNNSKLEFDPPFRIKVSNIIELKQNKICMFIYIFIFFFLNHS